LPGRQHGKRAGQRKGEKWMERKNICLVSAEGVPFVKVGGMADVVGSLYKYLKNKHNIYLFMPFYRTLQDNFKTEVLGDITVNFSSGRKETGFLARSLEYPGVYFLGKEEYFGRKELYGPGGMDYPDNAERFSFFAKGVLESAVKAGISVDIFHCHDWHTSLLPVYLREYYADSFPGAKTLFTIHNLAYQGIFPPDKFNILGLHEKYYSMEELEFYGSINFMKAGIIHSDSINTVSPKYAGEILTEKFGSKLEGLLKKNEGKLTGIINGIDYAVWNPSFDGLISKKYRTYRSKIINKLIMQKELRLNEGKEIPLFGMVTRLAEQKGIDELLDILDRILARNMELVVLGDGSDVYKNGLLELSRKYSGKVAVNFGFNETLAHRIYAASDFFLMPSRFEPCGLGQLISFKYGTVPIVRNVGGLADTVKDYSFATEEGTGFVFEGGSRELFESMERALRLFKNQESMARLSEKLMKLDFSWKASVEKYAVIYRSLTGPRE